VPVTIRIPTALRSHADGEARVEVDAPTVDEAVAGLVDRHGDLEEHLYTDDGEIRDFVNLYLNEEDVDNLQAGDTPVEDGDTLVLVPAVAGGASEGGLDPLSALREDVELDAEETDRYGRHLVLPDVGVEGQRRLKNAKVLCVGAGGLGAPNLLYLAAAGVGTIGIIDADVVESTNLQRQVIYGESDVGDKKLEAAERRLKDLNPHIEIVRHDEFLTSENALEVFEQYDLVVDGADNFPTRYLVNDASVLTGTPNVHGSIFRFEGQVSVFGHPDGPCYRCLYPEPPPPGLVPNCAEGGVLGVLPGVVGCMQSIEAIKLLVGEGDPLVGRNLLFDALEMDFNELNVEKDPDCPVCGEDPTVTELIDYEQFCGVPAFGEDEEEAEAEEDGIPAISASELHERVNNGGEVEVLDVREPNEWEICNLADEAGATLIPQDDVPNHLDDLPEDRELVVHCRSGGRSSQVVEYLREQGFDNAVNLDGGLLAWASEVDEDFPTY
jgi:adenylyltransferase/sulfurtransferase